jgi:hypothetical protein
MLKTKEYFSHDYEAREDEKIQRLEDGFGMLGYGVYWALVEICYKKGGGISASFIRSISKRLAVRKRIVSAVLTRYSLFRFDAAADMHYCDRALRSIEKRRERLRVALENGSKGGRPKAGENTGENQTETKSKPNANQPKTNGLCGENQTETKKTKEKVRDRDKVSSSSRLFANANTLEINKNAGVGAGAHAHEEILSAHAIVENNPNFRAYLTMGLAQKHSPEAHKIAAAQLANIYLDGDGATKKFIENMNLTDVREIVDALKKGNHGLKDIHDYHGYVLQIIKNKVGAQ